MAVSWAHSAGGETASSTGRLIDPAQETGSSTAGLRSGPTRRRTPYEARRYRSV